MVFLCVAPLLATGCGQTEVSPTSPTPVGTPTTPTPTPTPTPPPSSPGVLTVTINPNPVPWSGQPIPDSPGCNGVPNTWFYSQLLKNTGGRSITVSDRVDFFNGRESSRRNALGIVIAPGAETSITTRWCSAATGAQTARTAWSGQDAQGTAISVSGATVTLNPR